MSVPSKTLLAPRKYQEEILRQALNGNVIAALQTGSGKTYIAILLMRWVAAQRSASIESKKIVFVVPRVALVLQQAAYITKHTTLRVVAVHGSDARSAEERGKWRETLSRADVLVVTAQAFLNLITHSNWSLTRISLLILDECHHTRKNHPFNTIMKEYFHCPKSDRPKVFGMTASPTWNINNPHESLAELERNMDSKIFTVQDHIDELNTSSPKPTEEICKYEAPPETYPTYVFPTIWTLFEVGDVPANLDIPWDKIKTRYQAAFANLGQFGAEMYLHAELCARITTYLSSPAGDEKSLLRSRFLEHITDATPSSETADSPLAPLQNVLEDYITFFDFSYEGKDLPSPWSFSLTWCTPKVIQLIELISRFHTDAMKGIVFVEQRHIAVHLTRILNRAPELYGRIRAAEIIGIGDSDAIGTSMAASAQHTVLRGFHEDKVNILIATQVAEEGLDFPACDLVIRFDGLQNLVGYVQSRGRARHAQARFIVMVQGDDSLDLARYRKLSEIEPEIKQLYASHITSGLEFKTGTDGDDEEVTAADLAERERLVVPETGATLTYNSAINLLDRLCALVPHDPYMDAPKPIFSGGFECTLQLPSSLPFDRADLVFHGPRRLSKREARRAVAFRAVKRLYDLDIFDKYLLPTPSRQHDRDLGDQPLPDIFAVPVMMEVVVRDPWTTGPTLWTHPVYVNNRLVAGLVTGSILPPVELNCDGLYHTTGTGSRIDFSKIEETAQRELLQQYTTNALWWCNTGRPQLQPLSCFLVPVDSARQPDFNSMEQLLGTRLGSYDWTPITEAHTKRLLIRNRFQHGRTYLFYRIHRDLTPSSRPAANTREGGFNTFLEYFRAHYQRRGINADSIPNDGPLVEAFRVQKQSFGSFDLTPDGTFACNPPFLDEQPYLLPLRACAWSCMPEDMFTLYRTFPRLLRRITSVYRARIARRELGLPAVKDDLLIEAFTLPSAGASFNNQRLETLGDLVLKLCASVHLFNRYPYRHEGQLDRMRSFCVKNTTLLAHAKQIGLEEFLTSETQCVKSWPYVAEEGSLSADAYKYNRRRRRRIPRRSLQDCMEACLGASWLSGGIDMALRTGTYLGLNFGGTIPWSMRYSRPCELAVIPSIFSDLQERLGYEFRQSETLLEAFTHPTFSLGGVSYQRLEFLGDALIDLPLVTYLYHKFPKATSGQLANMREHAVCAPVLAWVAVNKFHLHKLLLTNSMELSTDIAKHVLLLEGITCEDIVKQSWAYDPPKALCDVFESLIAAVLLDSGYNLEKVNAVVESSLSEVIEVLSPELERDPVSQLMVWAGQSGCKRIRFQKSKSHSKGDRLDSAAIFVHDLIIGETVTASSLSVAKAFASASAHRHLRDSNSDFFLGKLCDCQMSSDLSRENVDSLDDVKTASISTELSHLLLGADAPSSINSALRADTNPEEEMPDEGTEAGFATIARRKLEGTLGYLSELDAGDSEDDAGSAVCDRPDEDSCLSTFAID